MTCSCPAASSTLTGLKVRTETLTKGTRLWRFHGWNAASKQFPADNFNPYPKKNWTLSEEGPRFSPFPLELTDKHYVPALYAAEKAEHAALESVFHDVLHAPNQRVSQRLLESSAWHLSELEVLTDAKILHLANPNLAQVPVTGRPISLTEGELLQSWPEYYAQTRAWARLLYLALPEVQGFRFHSRKASEPAYVLYEGRGLSVKAFGSPQSITDPKVWKIVAKAAARAHIEMV